MADLLPKFIVIQSTANQGYAVYSTDPAPKYIYTLCNDVFNPYVKIEVEIAKINRKYVHLRFYHSNRYWARGADTDLMVATSNQPDEDTSKKTCTLLEPTLSCDGRLTFTHVQSRSRVKVSTSTTRIWVDDKVNKLEPCPDADYAFSFVDWDTLVKIPKRVTFKGDSSGKYLKANDNYKMCTFTSTDGTEKKAAYEVYLQPDGYIRIKSVYYGMFFRYNSSYGEYLVADLSDHTAGKTEDLFWPVSIDEHTIALRSAGHDNKFCIQQQLGSDYFQAAGDCIAKEARLVVEELVFERKIYNVEYRMEDARVYDELPFLAGTGTAANESDQESSMIITFTYEHTQSSCFTSTQCAIVGVNTIIEAGAIVGDNSVIEAGIPSIAYGKIEVSATETNTLIWGTTTVEKTTTLATYTAKVPPKSRVTVNYMGTKGKCSVPFSYTQRDKCSYDGQIVTSRQIDGVFQGVNSYNFNFKELPIESIVPPVPPC